MDERSAETMDLKDYEVVRKEMVEEQDPDIWIRFDPSNGGKILLSGKCSRFLRKPPYVQILINPDVKRLLLRALWRIRDRKRRGMNTAIKVSYEGNMASVQGSCGILINKLMEVMQWEPGMCFQVIGQKVSNETRNLLSFPLDKAVSSAVVADCEAGDEYQTPTSD